MVGIMSELVSLYRCVHCPARMFEQDCAGHLKRHGWNIHSSEIRTHFIKGPRNTFPRPGARDEGIYQVHQRRKAVAQDKRRVAEEEDEAFVN